MENARIVRCVRMGQESRLEFDPKPMEELKNYLKVVPAPGDEALGGL